MRLMSALRVLVASLAFLIVVPALAEEPVPEAAWQETISGQIEAFRHGDAPAAFGYASSTFQKAFPSALVFMQAIAASGYTPIFLSASHSFGTYQRASEKEVIQVVRFIGSHQELYEAMYDVVEEEAGWKVVGVVLGKAAGIGV